MAEKPLSSEKKMGSCHFLKENCVLFRSKWVFLPIWAKAPFPNKADIFSVLFHEKSGNFPFRLCILLEWNEHNLLEKISEIIDNSVHSSTINVFYLVWCRLQPDFHFILSAKLSLFTYSFQDQLPNWIILIEC